MALLWSKGLVNYPACKGLSLFTDSLFGLLSKNDEKLQEKKKIQ